jgi:hypothetical protein
VSGKIIAMTPAVGFITEIMTRCMCSALNQKLDRNSNLNIYHKQNCIRANSAKGPNKGKSVNKLYCILLTTLEWS